MDKTVHFDAKTIAGLGIIFPAADEAETFASFLQEEYEVRVGQELSMYLTDEELCSFDEIDDLQEAAEWLEAHCPNYRSVVQEVRERIENELLQYRGRIPGAVRTPP